MIYAKRIEVMMIQHKENDISDKEIEPTELDWPCGKDLIKLKILDEKPQSTYIKLGQM